MIRAPKTIRNKANVVKAAHAASQASYVKKSAEVIYEEVGKHILDEGTQQVVREGVEAATTLVLEYTGVNMGKEIVKKGTKAIVKTGAKTAAKKGTKAIAKKTLKKAGAVAFKEGGKAAAKEGSKVAAKEILKGVGRAAGIGFAIDGAVGVAEGAWAYKQGTMNATEATSHAAKEASTGALASAAGVGLAAVLVVATGPAAPLTLAIVAGGGALGTKLGLMAIFA